LGRSKHISKSRFCRFFVYNEYSLDRAQQRVQANTVGFGFQRIIIGGDSLGAPTELEPTLTLSVGEMFYLWDFAKSPEQFSAPSSLPLPLDQPNVLHRKRMAEGSIFARFIPDHPRFHASLNEDASDAWNNYYAIVYRKLSSSAVCDESDDEAHAEDDDATGKACRVYLTFAAFNR